ncbi:MAG: Phenylserine dehydratase [Alphaproteobacteria bacterium MarineAlpha3_Bin4]|nr:MAG: Phenylserine dehydratase [Alphaproteobacteria bacterium MarineAlpha3_Bin4]
MATQVVTLADIDAAAERIKDHVRRTPCLRSRFTLNPLHRGELLLKLECLQVTGSFKARGASNAVLALDSAARARGIITASGGNHGLAVAYASHFTGVPAVVYLPELTLAEKTEKIRAWGADVVVEGSVWDDANDAAMARAELDGLTYIAPFSDPAVIAGQGTVGREMLQQSPHIDILIVAIGGGGLISGVATAAKAIKPEITVIGVEPVGAPTLKTSVEKGRLVTLPGIDTEAVTLAPRKSAEINLDIVRRNVDDIILVSDDEMREAARWLWFEAGVAAELSGAASLAALQAGRVGAPAESVVSAVVCGTGIAGLA